MYVKRSSLVNYFPFSVLKKTFFQSFPDWKMAKYFRYFSRLPRNPVLIVRVYLILRVETHVYGLGRVMYNHQDSSRDRTSETFCDSVRIHFPCNARVSCCCMVSVCLVVLSSLYRTYVYSTLVCRYAPIFVFSKATCYRFVSYKP